MREGGPAARLGPGPDRSGCSASANRLTTGFRPLVLAASLGLLHAVSFAPWGCWWAQLVVLCGFATLTQAMIRHRRSPRLVALAGLLFGFGWFLAGVGWLYVSMHTYGLMPAPLALLALVLFALYLALFPAAAAGLTALLCRGAFGDAIPSSMPAPRAWVKPTLRFASSFAASLTLAELVRGYLFTGFPWLAVGYAQMDGPLTGFAAVAGSPGVGFAACFIAALLANLAHLALARDPLYDGRAVPAIVAPLASIAALLVIGQMLLAVTWSHASGEPLKIRLLQGNVPQQMKFDPRIARQTMQRYLELIEAEPADLIVLPETAWTVPWASTPPELADRLKRFVQSSGSAVAIGLPLVTVAGGESRNEADRPPSATQSTTLTNSVLLFDRAAFAAGAIPMRYDKRHLVPFGEFVPWGFRWFVDLMTIPLGDFGRGADDQPPFAVGQQRISFNICYEDVFGEELLPALRGEDGATILANVSNIAWFGDSHALPQHLQIARMRALETSRPMIRATNTGVTAAIDFDGKVLAALPPYQLGALSVMVQGRRGFTPYARTGNWPILAFSVLLLAAALVPDRKPAKIAP